ncbi:ABC transporter substrate-binding protein [Marinomonas sp. 15G1-11]|uniref:ABC transporter substrate-binding protein n=1 Tax=Marinomonas phaeophyticola TaxID=3004091 RepID=A0ABT4JTM8_9GAMM|nr:ABC transporter substrate-binding protein [Marinomonas sp. 15G1-11]MCZ2721382.1 ABC transporter substrate-binding protein [Marinomonas sp. 15G1-11]
MNTISRRTSLKWMLMMGSVATSMFASLPSYADDTKINVGALRFTSHAATFVAFERGYFKDEGLDVEFKFFQAAQPMAVGVASKDIDYAVTAISGGLISLAEKGAIKVIGGALMEEAGVEGQKIIVSNKAFDAGITTPEKLDGKSFAITQAGSSFHYVGAKMAEKEGIELTYKPMQKVGTIIGALKSGQIDGWSIVPHIAKPLDAAGAVHIIGNVADYIPNYQVTTVFTSADHAANKAETTKAFLRAFSRGAADFNEALVDKTAGEAASEDMIKLIHKYVYADRPYEKAAPSIRNGAMRISANAALNMESVQDQLDWFKSEKLIKDSITIDTLVDASYLQ